MKWKILNRHVVHVTYKYIPGANHILYRGTYCGITKLGTYMKALWATRYNWRYFNYIIE